MSGKLKQCETQPSRAVPADRQGKVRHLPRHAEKEAEVAKATARRINIPFIDLHSVTIDPSAADLLHMDMALKLCALPVRKIDGAVLVAMANPQGLAEQKALKLLTGCNIQPAAAPPAALLHAIRKYYQTPGVTGPEGTVRHDNGPAERSPIARTATVAIISNKGGVGKTHVAINAACALAETGARVLLIDADLGTADISNKLALFPRTNLLDFMNKDLAMQDVVVHTAFGFDLICGASGDFKMANLNYAQKMRFIRNFRTVSASYEFAVFDLSAGIGRTVLDFALAADHAVIVTTPQDIVSGYACLKACFFRFKQIEEQLESRAQDYMLRLTLQPLLIMNQVQSGEEGLALYRRMKSIADENINLKESRFSLSLEYLGSIPYDRKSFHSSETKRRPLLLDSPRQEGARCLRHMAQKFTKPDDHYVHRPPAASSLQRFFEIFSRKQ